MSSAGGLTGWEVLPGFDGAVTSGEVGGGGGGGGAAAWGVESEGPGVCRWSCLGGCHWPGHPEPVGGRAATEVQRWQLVCPRSPARVGPRQPVLPLFSAPLLGVGPAA